jgi:hypothetical protein
VGVDVEVDQSGRGAAVRQRRLGRPLLRRALAPLTGRAALGTPGVCHEECGGFRAGGGPPERHPQRGPLVLRQDRPRRAAGPPVLKLTILKLVLSVTTLFTGASPKGGWRGGCLVLRCRNCRTDVTERHIRRSG